MANEIIATEPAFGIQLPGTVALVNVHDPAQCEGQGCCVHHPSDHHMVTWTRNWRADRGLMERICPCHGVGHPDPDDVAFHESQGRTHMGVHGCIINDDGKTCCNPDGMRARR